MTVEPENLDERFFYVGVVFRILLDLVFGRLLIIYRFHCPHTSKIENVSGVYKDSTLHGRFVLHFLAAL